MKIVSTFQLTETFDLQINFLKCEHTLGEHWTNSQNQKLLGSIYDSKTRLKLIPTPTLMLWRKFLSLNLVNLKSKINIAKQVITLLNKRGGYLIWKGNAGQMPCILRGIAWNL